MTGASGGDDGDRDLRSTFESTTMDVHGIVHLTREIWCCLRRRGNAVRKEVAALASSPLYALQTIRHRPSSPRGSGDRHPVQSVIHLPPSPHQLQVCSLPLSVCSRVQPDIIAETTSSDYPDWRGLSDGDRSSALVFGAWPSDGQLMVTNPDTTLMFEPRVTAVAMSSYCDKIENSPPSVIHVVMCESTPTSVTSLCGQSNTVDDDVIVSRIESGAATEMATTRTPVHGMSARSRLAATKLISKGLLERRGSNASLTLDLSSTTSESPTIGSPPRESLVEEFLTSSSRQLTRRRLTQLLQNPAAVYEEFWKIPMNHPDKIEVPGSGIKNRYRTIIPNETTRVRLRQPNCDNPAAVNSISSTSTCSYINANYIRGYGGEPRAYIATQGPMSNTVNDFWSMVWQERCPVIVMITKLTEHNRTKCECYMPESTGVYGAVHVTIDSQLELDGLIIRYITIQCPVDPSTPPLHTVHYWYMTWPDQRAPLSATDQLLALIRQVELQRVDQSTGRSRGPVIVHCSAGIGRTGCFIATSIALQQLRQEQVVDILGIVCSMRLDRGGMIQTNEQYEFVHRAVDLFGQQELPSSNYFSAIAGSTWPPNDVMADDDGLT